MRRGVRFMLNRKLAMGFMALKRKGPSKKGNPMARAMRHFLNRNLSRGWSAWHLMWSELVRKRESMRRSA